MKKNLVLFKKAKNYRKDAKKFRWHHPFVIPVVVFFSLFFVSSGLFVAFNGETIGATDTKTVNLFFDGHETVVPTRAHTVGDFLANNDIDLGPADAVDPELRTPVVGHDFSIRVLRAKTYLIVDEDGKKTQATVAGVDFKDVVKKSGVRIYIEDRVFAEPSAVSRSTETGFVGTELRIKRAVPVHINLYGKSILVRTHKATVGEVLREKNIKSLKGDTVKPRLSTPIKKNMLIFVIRNGKKVINVEEKVSPPVEQIKDPEAPLGSEVVLDEGAPGKRIVTYEITVKKGKEVKRRKIQVVISVEPRARRVVVGTKTAGFDGSFDAALARLRSCEGSYTSSTGNGYYGAYQFDNGTWGNYGGYSNAASAPPYVQDQKAWETYQSRGWSPWPSCSASLGLQDKYR